MMCRTEHCPRLAGYCLLKMIPNIRAHHPVLTGAPILRIQSWKPLLQTLKYGARRHSLLPSMKTMVFLTISPPLLFRPTTRTAPWQENPPWTWLACTLTTARANKTTSTSGIPYPVIYVHLGWDHVFPCISFLHGARVVGLKIGRAHV